MGTFKPEAIEYFNENTNQEKDGYSEEERLRKQFRCTLLQNTLLLA